MAPFTVGHQNLAVASPEDGLALPFGAVCTHVGRWIELGSVPALAAAGFASGGEGNITFLSPTDGWICAYGVGALADDRRDPLASPRHG